MLLLVLTTATTAVTSLIFTWLRYKDKENISFVFKFLSSSGFLLIAIFAYQANGNNPEYFKWLMIALVLGFFGDIFLGLKNILSHIKKYMVGMGIILFLLGHIAYSINYNLQGGAPWWVFLITIAFAALMMQGTKLLKYKLSTFNTVLGYLYSYTISIMLLSAVSYYITYHDTVAAVLVLIGSISFFVSDSILSATYFRQNIKKENILCVIVHITYYLAQILLALSVYFV